MNFLQICTKVPFPPKDGGSAAVYALAKSFAKLGHHVDVLAINPAKHFISTDQLTPLPFTLYPIAMDTNTTLSGALGNLLFSGSSYHVQRFLSAEFKKELIGILSSNTYDVIQLEGVYLCSYIPLIRKYSQAKVSLRAHNVEHLLWQEITLRETRFWVRQYLKIQTQRLKKFEISQLGLTDVVVPISEKDEAVFRTLDQSVKSITIPFGIDPSLTAIGQPTHIQSVFYIGALDWIPNQEALLWFVEKVWPKVMTLIPDFVFHIAGRNAPRHLIESLRKHRQVKFDGEVDNSSEYMKNHDLMVVPLFSGSGMRVKIIEAMNHGKVIVASVKACEGIPVKNGIHVRMAVGIDEFVTAISAAVAQPETNLPIIAEAKRLVTENFDNLVLASKLVNFYRQELP